AAYFAGQLLPDALSARIHTRETEWAGYRQEYLQSPTQAYPAFLHGDAPLEAAPRRAGDVWQGRGVSPGLARGAARIILEARDLRRVARGEILVTPATDPGWTPVFARLAGLVLERGGVLAHAAIVAREYSLPAVAGLSNITQELNDGDWIEVDGTR